MQGPTYRTTLGSSELVVDVTPLASQAHGRVIVRLGDTTVLVTAVMSKHPRASGDFFPLTVDYEERFYAAGKILGSRFMRREGRPSEEAILVGRLIDRTIRPRFDLRMRNEVHVVATVLSFDGEHDPDLAALIGASLALSISDIPWLGPVAGVRIGIDENGDFIVNPSISARETSRMDLVVSGMATKINMLEAGAREIPEAKMTEALLLAQTEIAKLTAFEDGIIKAHGKAKREVLLVANEGPLADMLRKTFSPRMAEAMWEKDKAARNDHLSGIRSEWDAKALADFPESTPSEWLWIWEATLDSIIHEKIIRENERPDGRKADELRALSCEAGIIPRVHGSGLFTRGETQALSSVTLGSPGDHLLIEGMAVRTKRRFMHHYNFPPYSVGEIKPMRGPGRREIGHGALAERSLLAMIPEKEAFPYTIRIVSEILSSNGSSSMASVSGSTIALFDAGVPMIRPVAGIAMGLMLDHTGAYRVLTDIQGPEDHYGDMDFKAAGTSEGVTGMQMDVKIEGVSVSMLSETLVQARKARLEILDAMTKAIGAPRDHLSPYAPRIITLKIDPSKIGALIGPGGKMINSITEATGVTIDIEDDGSVFVTSEKEEGMDQALEMIKQVTHEYKPGELLQGTVSRIFGFGAMVEVAPKTEGLVHVSELAPWHVGRVEDVVNIGDAIPVMVKNVDEQGRLNLSLKDVPGKYSEEAIAKGRAEAEQRRTSGEDMRPPRGDRPSFGRGGGRGGPRFGRR